MFMKNQSTKQIYNIKCELQTALECLTWKFQSGLIFCREYKPIFIFLHFSYEQTKLGLK